MERKPTNYLVVAILALVCLTWTQGADAQGQKAKKQRAKTAGDRVDISGLEDKYWAPKDTDFSVVQNRTYTKDKRFSLSTGVGILINDPYNSAYVYDITGNYYLSERYGIEFSFTRIESEYGEVVSNLEEFAAGSARPNFSQLDSIYELGFNYVPFYAKVSVLGKRIIYFDMMITPTVGMVNYTQELQGGGEDLSAFAYGFNVSQHFFISKSITIRADLKNRWFNEERREWRVSDGQDSLGTVYNNTTTFTIGLQYFF